jgi:hypothetical protein
MSKEQQIKTMLDQLVKDSGVQLQRSAAEVAAYAIQRAAYLNAGGVVQPGWEEAVTAETHNVLLFAGISAVRNADSADARLLGFFLGVLTSLST